jgi:hypothetical protein
MRWLAEITPWWATGLWAIVWKYGVTGVAVAGLVAFSLAADRLGLPGLRKTALWAAGALVYGLVAFSVGILNESTRRDEMQNAGLKVEAADGEKAHDDAVHDIRAAPPGSVRNDRHNRDTRQK